MSYKAIQLALDSRLNALPGGLPVAWENVKYTPVLGRPWLRPTLINADSQLICLADGNQNNPGIYRVDAFYPVGNGVGQILDKLDQIYTLFKEQQILISGDTKVSIRNISVLQRIVEETSWLMGSVNINFVSYDNLI